MDSLKLFGNFRSSIWPVLYIFTKKKTNFVLYLSQTERKEKLVKTFKFSSRKHVSGGLKTLIETDKYATSGLKVMKVGIYTQAEFNQVSTLCPLPS